MIASTALPVMEEAVEESPRRRGVSEIALTLEDTILRGEWRPGDRLNELALSRRLGISRAALREAVRLLEQMGLVAVVPNRGVIVREVSVKDALDLYDLRAALFRMAAQLAARRCTASALAALRALNAAMREDAAAERFADYYARNLDFHAALIAAAGNAPLAQAYANATKSLHLFRRRALLNPVQLDLSLAEHEAILAAIAVHDAAAAGEAAEAHILVGRDRMLDTLDRGIQP
ncbi:GntR family transcriptional regulator [Sediminicoccus rosea]|jgi:DNA-binding GntR family transcriptional regulator|uniref:GntR family transcriptional regulator n=1 Tax=Sediminicoccus rosea TaxID=1225128 RepID=A0ABZ0PJW6_9PROT|nr:GntR family transcriptional regulator [Sediminicoccus rosea]WPB86025.1 GntR family transcriptional regulator [Sediminicoccus rosea]